MQEVPNLNGISIIKLEEIIKANNLRFEIIDSSKFTSKFNPLSVIEHLPSAGQLVKKNRKIFKEKCYLVKKKEKKISHSASGVA